MFFISYGRVFFFIKPFRRVVECIVDANGALVLDDDIRLTAGLITMIKKIKIDN